jgi:S1-C subfamily serine protease
VASTAIVAAVIGALAGAWIGIGSQQTVVEKFFPNQSVIANPVDVQGVIAQAEPAVVSIDTIGYPAGGEAGEVLVGAGTGMILTSSGMVLTNNHVIAGASTITVTLFGQTKRLGAHVIGADPATDVALVQIDGGHDLPTVTLGNSDDVEVGDNVVAIGNALGLPGGPTVTEGIVSGLNRTLSAESDFTKATENLHGLIETDAPINSGNSGGPLLNSQAQVIGMNTAVAESTTGNAPAQNIGFAIAVNTIKALLPTLGGSGINLGVALKSGSG